MSTDIKLKNGLVPNSCVQPRGLVRLPNGMWLASETISSVHAFSSGVMVTHAAGEEWIGATDKKHAQAMADEIGKLVNGFLHPLLISGLPDVFTPSPA